MNEQNKMQIFANDAFGRIRTILGEDGEPRFCLVDICKALGLSTNGITRRLGYGVISNHPIADNLGRQQNGLFVNEDGLYDVILESRKPEAKAFRKWVTSEVLPSIRKNGAYFTPDAVERLFSDPKFLVKMAMQYERERELRMQAEKQLTCQQERIKCLNEQAGLQKKLINEQQLTIEQQISRITKLEIDSKYLQMILASKSAVKVTQIAQDYGMSAVRFNRLLSEHRVHYRINGQWILYMDYKDKGYAMGETVLLPNGNTVMHTCWTQKGRMFLYFFLKDLGVLPLIER